MKKLKRFFVILLAFFLALSVLLTARIRLKSALQSFAEANGNAKLTLALQNALYQHLADSRKEYLTLHYDASERITAISVHSEMISVLASELTMILLNTLDQYQNPSFGIPLGNLTDSVLLSGKGPLIPLRPVAIGHIANEIQSNLKSAGINQTLHQVLIRFTVAVRYLAPIETFTDTITIEIVVAETLVVGEVPIYRD